MSCARKRHFVLRGTTICYNYPNYHHYRNRIPQPYTVRSYLYVLHVLVEQDLAVDLAALDQRSHVVLLGQREADLTGN